MDPVRVLSGQVAPLFHADIDTDQIMPKQFLKLVTRTGFGEHIFHDWREDPDFILNDPDYQEASVLVTGPNFGCGSSREHAPWGLQQYGFEAIIAPTFADIFRNNCVKIGLLTVELDHDICRRLATAAEHDPATSVSIDLPQQTVQTPFGSIAFDIDPHAKHMLVEGLDEIDITMGRLEAIEKFEASRPTWKPVLTRSRSGSA